MIEFLIKCDSSVWRSSNEILFPELCTWYFLVRFCIDPTLSFFVKVDLFVVEEYLFVLMNSKVWEYAWVVVGSNDEGVIKVLLVRGA